jgi:hypothetical protein
MTLKLDQMHYNLIKYIKHRLSCKEDQWRSASSQYYQLHYDLINYIATWSVKLQLDQLNYNLISYIRTY